MRQMRLSKTGAGETAAAPLDLHGDSDISLQVVVTGTVNYTVQQTLDNPFDASITATWFDHSDSNLVGATASKQGNYSFVPAAVRLKVNSGDGTAVLTIIQAGL